jgi:phosphocarrier protein
MGVMMLAAAKGTEIRVNAVGDDAEAALAAIGTLINDYFGEGE